MAKKRGRPKGSKNKVKPQAKTRAQRGPKLQCVLLHTQLRPIIREAARTGLVEAIEHTSNFWDVSHGYKKYIEQQIELQSEALMAAVKTSLRGELAHLQDQIGSQVEAIVRTAVRAELSLREIANRRRKR